MFRYIHKFISIFVLAAFFMTSVKSPAYAQSVQQAMMPRLPVPGVMVHLSPEFTPAHLLGITIHSDNALQFDFLIHRGDQDLDGDQKKVEYKKLVKYFLASLTIPDEDQWVNLSPYEKDRIIKDDFGKTEMGRDLLAQDYLLKQITSSLIYPEDGLGKKFWDKVYERAWQEYHTTDIPVNTFNKVWIVPDQAIVYESGNSAYILQSHLKVMLEEDYLSLSKHQSTNSGVIARSPQGDEAISKRTTNDTHSIGSQVIREIILPELEKEVNEGRNFANLRQMFSGMVLATWYKMALKESLLGKVYADKVKVQGVTGITSTDPGVIASVAKQSQQRIYQRYLKAFKKGVFNYIKEDVDKYTNESIPRKYFSGGFQPFINGAIRWDGKALLAGQNGEEVVDPKTIALLPRGTLTATSSADIGTNDVDAMTTNMATTFDVVTRNTGPNAYVPKIEHLGRNVGDKAMNAAGEEDFTNWGPAFEEAIDPNKTDYEKIAALKALKNADRVKRDTVSRRDSTFYENRIEAAELYEGKLLKGKGLASTKPFGKNRRDAAMSANSAKVQMVINKLDKEYQFDKIGIGPTSIRLITNYLNDVVAEEQIIPRIVSLSEEAHGEVELDEDGVRQILDDALRFLQDEAMLTASESKEISRQLSILQETASAVQKRIYEQKIDNTLEQLKQWLQDNPGIDDVYVWDQMKKEEILPRLSSLKIIVESLSDKLGSVLTEVKDAKAKREAENLEHKNKMIDPTRRLVDENTLDQDRRLYYDLSDKLKKMMTVLNYQPFFIDAAIGRAKQTTQERIRVQVKFRGLKDILQTFQVYSRMVRDIIEPSEIDRGLSREGFESRGFPQNIYDFLIPATDPTLMADEQVLQTSAQVKDVAMVALNQEKLQRAFDNIIGNMFARDLNATNIALSGFQKVLREDFSGYKASQELINWPKFEPQDLTPKNGQPDRLAEIEGLFRELKDEVANDAAMTAGEFRRNINEFRIALGSNKNISYAIGKFIEFLKRDDVLAVNPKQVESFKNDLEEVREHILTVALTPDEIDALVRLLYLFEKENILSIQAQTPRGQLGPVEVSPIAPRSGILIPAKAFSLRPRLSPKEAAEESAKVTITDLIILFTIEDLLPPNSVLRHQQKIIADSLKVKDSLLKNTTIGVVRAYIINYRLTLLNLALTPTLVEGIIMDTLKIMENWRQGTNKFKIKKRGPLVPMTNERLSAQTAQFILDIKAGQRPDVTLLDHPDLEGFIPVDTLKDYLAVAQGPLSVDLFNREFDRLKTVFNRSNLELQKNKNFFTVPAEQVDIFTKWLETLPSNETLEINQNFLLRRLALPWDLDTTARNVLDYYVEQKMVSPAIIENKPKTSKDKSGGSIVFNTLESRVKNVLLGVSTDTLSNEEKEECGPALQNILDLELISSIPVGQTTTISRRELIGFPAKSKLDEFVKVLHKAIYFLSDKERDKFKLDIYPDDRQNIVNIRITPNDNSVVNPDINPGPDRALLTPTGGIDFNAANMNLQIKRDGRGVPLPLSQQDMAQLNSIQGFVPEIIEIRPAVNVPIINELQQKLQSSLPAMANPA
jgi:hypothetical protein